MWSRHCTPLQPLSVWHLHLPAFSFLNRFLVPVASPQITTTYSLSSCLRWSFLDYLAVPRKPRTPSTPFGTACSSSSRDPEVVGVVVVPLVPDPPGVMGRYSSLCGGSPFPQQTTCHLLTPQGQCRTFHKTLPSIQDPALRASPEKDDPQDLHRQWQLHTTILQATHPQLKGVGSLVRRIHHTRLRVRGVLIELCDLLVCSSTAHTPHLRCVVTHEER